MTTKDNIVSFPSAAPSRQAGRLLIPERLTEARRAARMTQTELAQKVSVSRQAVSAYELGEKSPDIPVLHRLAEELPTSPPLPVIVPITSRVPTPA